MSHPLEAVMRTAEPVLVIGDSGQGRFPAISYASYVRSKKRFYCLDLGGLTVSRGPVKGEPVYTSAADLPETCELAHVWVKPRSAARAVEIAKEAGCTRVWFSFATGHRDAVARAGELGLEVVEIGRCPLMYVEDPLAGCAAHAVVARLTGAYGKAPQADPNRRRRELF